MCSHIPVDKRSGHSRNRSHLFPRSQCVLPWQHGLSFFFHLCDLPLCVTCSKMNPLAEKEILSLDDLHGKTLLLARREVSNYTAPIWDEIEAHHPQIRLKGAEYCDINLFNQLVSSDEFMLSAECWKGVHPLLTTLPVDWDYTMPYGLIYSKNPSKELLQFLMAVGQMEN